ncbi:bifunctional alpha/beta hydrolase/class I SAM-dependent methyltransferase [Sulfurospirillum cavolei]|uniref:bifunctional alpha/beta hydrolase/class I SAM-dependent methyltransferase n=1 Tax=Sulfurospirillum cavolei TaxID=366522 RepID=UPI0005A7A071|nr:bifunctional alpha/beta hydrolase/class I SAM-dependent methyltransferase [Sulfurospirillum cavolei]
MKTGTFRSFDKAELFYREWEPTQEANGKVVLLLHRGHEHSERLDSIARSSIFAGYKVFSYDNRGHGYTKEGAAYEFMNLVRDLDAFVQFVCEKEHIAQEAIFVVANSVAGVVASTWVHDFAPKIAGMALVAPAFKIKLYVPLAKPALALMLHFKEDLTITSYVKAKFLTHNVEEQKRYNTDPLITPNIPAKQLVTLLDTAQRVVEDASLIVTPTLVLSATADYVVESSVQKVFYDKLSSPLKRFVALEGFYHGVLYEQNAQIALDAIGAFMREAFAAPKVSLKEHLIQITQLEKDTIAKGEIPFLQNCSFAFQRFMLHRFGGLSEGISIGLRYGFDSGVTLDYIYKNTPNGKGALGRMIDKNYLNSIGWKGIRQRKVNAIVTIREKIEHLRAQGEKVRILDIAGGPARYLIELAREYPDIEVLVRDYQEQNIEQGRALAKEFSLKNIRYEQADAFDKKTYENRSYQPNIVIISGVFELFEENALIQNAIDGVTSMMPKGSFLVYTGQPWHPQLEQIAYVLGNHQQKQWIMRRRSQYELDSLFAQSGFEKNSMKIDDWGIFTVSVAALTCKDA